MFFLLTVVFYFFVLASVAVVFRLCRAADAVPRTRRLIGFFCRRTASMEQAADGAEAAAVDQYFSSPFSILSACGHRDYRLMIEL